MQPSKLKSVCSGSRARPWHGTVWPRCLSQYGLDLSENARLFGLLNLALADGYTSDLETKHHHNYWRPGHRYSYRRQ